MSDATGVNAAAVVLAAGKGTRMRSDLPKTLHAVGGTPMLGHTLACAAAAGAHKRVVVTGHQSARVEEAARAIDPAILCAVQEPQLGTGHAVMQARDALAGFTGDVMVLYADTPLIRTETLERMRAARREGAAVVVLGFDAEEPAGYGRLILDDKGGLDRIVEAKDATPEELAVKLCNSGVMCIDGALLDGLLSRVTNENAKGEYYLTDIVEIARADGAACAAVLCDEAETLGVNDRVDLAAAEAAFQKRARIRAMREGATLTAPDTVYFSHDTRLGSDVIIEPHVVFGPGVRVADNARIRAFSTLEGCAVAMGAEIGPYARLRPGADIGEDAKIGNFVEVKNTTFAKGAKANHLSYIGDAHIGAGANIGAGTITCNYDGYLKHRTEIGDGVFVGSNTALVAPVAIGQNATIGAGSVVTRDVEADALAVARGRQENKPGLAKMLRRKLADIKAAKSAG